VVCRHFSSHLKQVSETVAAVEEQVAQTLTAAEQVAQALAATEPVKLLSTTKALVP
jgi:ABC-type transporter Mla subunit MlaD